MHKLQKALPPNAVLDYLPASFNPSEDWPMFQLAYITAQSLGVADQSHDAMFDAVWTSRELSVIDPATQRIRDSRRSRMRRASTTAAPACPSINS
jgi:thiol:disulfide interchange protein DsbA